MLCYTCGQVRCRSVTTSKERSAYLLVCSSITWGCGCSLELSSCMQCYSTEQWAMFFVCIPLLLLLLLPLRMGCNCCEAEKMKMRTKQSSLSPFPLSVLLLACLQGFRKKKRGVFFPVIMLLVCPSPSICPSIPLLWLCFHSFFFSLPNT